jgi:hypothetical protein
VESLVVLKEHAESPAVHQLVCFCVRASLPWLGRASPLQCCRGDGARGGVRTPGSYGLLKLNPAFCYCQHPLN